MPHSSSFIETAISVCEGIDTHSIELIAERLMAFKGRLFILGVGGSAANASHAVNDFRKLCGIEAYAPTDNVAELTARTNDEGWKTTFSAWLKVSKFDSNDALFIFSVGGGTATSSPNIIEAIKLARKVGAIVFGVVGKNDGYTAKHADLAICIPAINKKWITPMSEAFQLLILHMLVSHPLLQTNKTKF